ncbi:branched-chain alpha-keto acid dehydrogenase subunit E2 [Aliikangiella marina]|uniref:Branched-chain alpha-keto acid dehydrogenase subunit E2 n=1 Tax=Aliikangiella marina TaxID=1712262 RepID=A0A545T2F4_9GAMM|nr:cytochrome b/b6 domain-containing protein [Aliikangiella marina]TQV71396.1 branched-chain alpha-keto acid dehydrogenase subunit E2 [Aliikangiella marina]
MKQSSPETLQMVLVWDWPIRLFHWLLVANLVFLITTGNVGGDWIIWHIRSAYILSGLILFRILWGVFGSYYARFHQFVVSPFKSFSHLMSLIKGNPSKHYGHNPAGAVMVIVLLVALLSQFLAGTVISDDIMWYGPFYSWVSESLSSLGTRIHYQMEIVLIVLAAVHILAVMYHQFVLKEKLVQAMLHGKKEKEANEPRTVSFNPIVLIVIVLFCVAWVVWLWSLPV